MEGKAQQSATVRNLSVTPNGATAPILRARSTASSQQPVPNGHRTPLQNQNRAQNGWLASSRPPFRHIPAVVDWPQYSVMALRLRDVPDVVTTWHIWQSLEQLVKVLSIDLFEDRMGNRNGIARVRIEPPKRNHWDRGTMNINIPNENPARVRVEIDPTGFSRVEQLRSPLGSPVPARMEVKLASLDFGFMLKEHTMMNMRSLKSPGILNNFKVVIDFKKKNFHIFFPLELQDITVPGGHHRIYEYKIEIGFSCMTRQLRQVLPSGRTALIISLRFPPPIFRKTAEPSSTHSPDRVSWSEHELWHRQINIMHDPLPMRKETVSLKKPAQYIDIGSWTTYRLEFDEQNSPVWSSAEGHLGDFNIKTKHDPDFQLVDRVASRLWDILDPPSNDQHSLDQLEHRALPFPVRYQLEVCLSRGIFNEYNVDAEFIQRLASMPEDDAVELLESIADVGSRIYDPMAVFSDPLLIQKRNEYGLTTRDIAAKYDYVTLVRKVIVTPTTMHVNTPTVETNNRVLRKYIDYKDRFLRVQFTDELPEGRINPSADAKKNDELYTRIYRVLMNGIRIGDLHYQLLAFGNSQFRENGAYFFAPTDHLSCDDIRNWMGDFSTIKNVAKYAARLGQCFSTTRLILGVTTPHVVPIADVNRNGYCFTDGVGKMSEFWAKMISTHLHLDPVPSAFQFRMGGCKGVLAVSSDAKRGEIHIRPSQEKFRGAIFNGLEIIRCSKTCTPTLNQQSITILSSLGVPNEVFQELLDNEIECIENAVKDSEEAVVQLMKRIDENETTVAMAKMVRCGFMTSNEPFMWTLIQLWRSWSMKGLKEKARIPVEDGAFVLGCVDETDTLRGHSAETETNIYKRQDRNMLPQIFLQIPDRQDPMGRYKVITGLCLVGRNPSLHPGDIRVVEAVDVPQLRHLRDVVVFPRKGDRDIPSMCSGGDLDGDDFFVFWNKDLLPDKSEWNYPPMAMTSAEAPQVENGVTLMDLSRFFVIYMKNDSLPRIALAHRAQADRLETHAKHPNCLQLAELHSRAVDYVKSGIPAQMPKRLQPRTWPHWMEKHNRSQYRSAEPLGQIYDKVQTVDFQPAYDRPFDARILNRYTLDKDTLRKARKLKSLYDKAVRRLMAQKEVATEFELWTGFVLTRPRVGSGYKQAEDVGREVSALKTHFRDICLREAGCATRADTDLIQPFAAAMYRVTREEVLIALHECRRTHISPEGVAYRRRMDARSMPLISFPWLFDRELGHIATGSTREPSLKGYVASGWGVSRQQKQQQQQQSGGEDGVEDEEKKDAPSLPEPQLKMDLAALEDMDYVRTADGVVTHRGEPLTLFGLRCGEDNEDDEVELHHEEEGVKEHKEPGGVSEEGDGKGEEGRVREFLGILSGDDAGQPSTRSTGASSSSRIEPDTPAAPNPEPETALAPTAPASAISSSSFPSPAPSSGLAKKEGEPSLISRASAEVGSTSTTNGVNGTTRTDLTAAETLRGFTPGVGASPTPPAEDAGYEVEYQDEEIILPTETALMRAARLFGE